MSGEPAMRLPILQSGHDRVSAFGLRLLARANRGHVADVLKVTFYRTHFFGTPYSDLVEETLRGPSFWTPAEREVFAAYTSRTNDCPFCVAAHGDMACSYLGEEDELVDAGLTALDAADLRPEARAVLAFLDRLSHSPDALTASDVREARKAGVSDEALDEAIRVCALLHVMNRVLNAVGGQPGDSRQRAASVRARRRFGYRVPAPIRVLSRSR